MIRESEILQIAKNDMPEWLDTDEVTTFHEMLDVIGVLLDYPSKSMKEEITPLFVKYAVYDRDYIKSSRPDLYHLIEGVSATEGTLEVPEKTTTKGTNEVTTTKENETTVIACERSVLKRHTAKIQKLRQEHKNIVVGLTCKQYGNHQIDVTVQQLADYGCQEIFVETRTGIDTERVITKHAIKQLIEGDTLVLFHAVNLAKSSTQLFKYVSDLYDKGIKVISLTEAWLDTTTQKKADALMTFMKGMQKFEQDILVECKNNAVKKAQSEGTRFGRNLKDNADVDRAIEMYKNHRDEYTLTKIAQINNISRTTLWRRLRNMNLLDK